MTKQKLRFYAKEDLLVLRSDIVPVTGQPFRYVGRKYDPETRTYPATEEPFECDADSAIGKRLIKLMRRDNCLIPADAETSKVCGVSYFAKII